MHTEDIDTRIAYTSHVDRICYNSQTGASGGIGAACAWSFAEAGCKLVLLARRAEKLEEIKQQLQAEYKVLPWCPFSYNAPATR